MPNKLSRGGSPLPLTLSPVESHGVLESWGVGVDGALWCRDACGRPTAPSAQGKPITTRVWSKRVSVTTSAEPLARLQWDHNDSPGGRIV